LLAFKKNFIFYFQTDLQLRKRIVAELQLEKQRIRKARINRAGYDGTGVDCGSKQCTLEFHFKEKCAIFIPTNSTDCEIPCKTNGCKVETHHFISCPLWFCTPHSTTSTSSTSTSTTSATSTTSSSSTSATSTTSSSSTSTPTTATTSSATTSTSSTTSSSHSTSTTTSSSRSTTSTSMIPTSTKSPSTFSDSSILYSSIALNFLLMSIILFLLRKQIKKCYVQQQERRQQRREDNEENYTSTNPILRRPINHNDYFTLTSNSSLNDDYSPLIVPPADSRRRVTATNPIRSQSTQSAISARSTTGNFGFLIFLPTRKENVNKNMSNFLVLHNEDGAIK